MTIESPDENRFERLAMEIALLPYQLLWMAVHTAIGFTATFVVFACAGTWIGVLVSGNELLGPIDLLWAVVFLPYISIATGWGFLVYGGLIAAWAWPLWLDSEGARILGVLGAFALMTGDAARLDWI